MPEKRLPEKGSPGFQENQGRLPAGWVVALCISAVFAGLYFFLAIGHRVILPGLRWCRR